MVLIKTKAIYSNFKQTKLAKINELEGTNDLSYKQSEMFQKFDPLIFLSTMDDSDESYSIHMYKKETEKKKRILQLYMAHTVWSNPVLGLFW